MRCIGSLPALVLWEQLHPGLEPSILEVALPPVVLYSYQLTAHDAGIRHPNKLPKLQSQRQTASATVSSHSLGCSFGLQDLSLSGPSNRSCPYQNDPSFLVALTWYGCRVLSLLLLPRADLLFQSLIWHLLFDLRWVIQLSGPQWSLSSKQGLIVGIAWNNAYEVWNIMPCTQ